MGPVYSFRWVPQERGPLFINNPAMDVFYDSFEDYSAGGLTQLQLNTSFNSGNTGIFGIVTRTARRTGYFATYQNFWFESFEFYSAGPITQLGSNMASGSAVALSGYIGAGYERYFVDSFEAYPTGSITLLRSGIGSGGAWGSGYVIDPNSSPTPTLAWIKFNEGAGTTFASAVGNGGGTLSSAGMWVPGFTGLGYALSGNGTSDGAATDHNVLFNSVSTITISCRFRLMTFADPLQMIIEIAPSGGRIDNGAGLAIYTSAGTLGWNASCAGGAAAGGFGGAITPPSVNDWHTMVLVLNRATSASSMYINGIAQSVSPFSYGASTATWVDYPMYILKRGNNTSYCSGAIDDVRIYTGDVSAYAWHIGRDGLH